MIDIPSTDTYKLLAMVREHGETIRIMNKSFKSIGEALGHNNDAIKNLMEHVKLLEEAYWKLKRSRRWWRTKPKVADFDDSYRSDSKNFPWPKASNVPDVPKGFDHPSSITPRETHGEHKEDPQATTKQGHHDDKGHGRSGQAQPAADEGPKQSKRSPTAGQPMGRHRTTSESESEE